MTRTTLKSLQAIIDEQALTISELRATLEKGRTCYKELQATYCKAIGSKNGKPSSGFNAKGHRVTRSVPSVQRPKSARRVEMDKAKAKAAASGSSTTC